MLPASPAIFGALPATGGPVEKGARGRLREAGDPKVDGISEFRFRIRARLAETDRNLDFREDPASGSEIKSGRRKNSFAYKTETCAVTNSNLTSPGRSRREEPENVFLRILAPNPGPRGGGPRKRSRAPRSRTGVPGPTRNLSRVELDEGRVPSDFRSPARNGGPRGKRGPRSPSEGLGRETCGNFGLPISNSCSPLRDRPDPGFPGRSRERSRLYSGKSASPLAAKRCISALSRHVSGIREKEKYVREAPEVPRRTSARSDPGVDRSAPRSDLSGFFAFLSRGANPREFIFFDPGVARGTPRGVLGKKSRGPSSSLNVFRTVSKLEKKHPSAPLHGKVAAASGKGPEIRKGGTRFHPGCGFRRSRTSAGVQVGTLERSGSAELRRRPGGPRFRSLRRAARFPLRSESRLPLPVLPETFKSVSNFLEINFFFLSFFSFSIAGCYVKTREELATAALHSTGGCIGQTSISKHSTGPADDSFSRSLLQFGGTPERGIHPDTLEPTPGSFQSPMEHRNEAHTTPLLPDGFRWTSKISQVQNLSFSPLPARLEPSLALATDSLSSTSPDGGAPVTGARTSQRPLPVDLEKFRSPKPLVLATTCRRLHHSLFPSTPTLSSLDFHTSLAPTPLLPTAWLPSPGPARDSALFRWTSKNFEVHFPFHIKLDPLTCEPRTNRAPLLPSPGPACPLPVDFSTR
ncbi:hypothetical protein TNCT_380841 [Trichonephila clavata]|uniref:Uncharacterized protein n=1 Tax=Trichonephila clavata TaxID=2740835 RepID=A0A8X6LX94_TRICU|nr:hypothetical protein TNCT_380841 [Trichonephila clavata]